MSSYFEERLQYYKGANSNSSKLENLAAASEEKKKNLHNILVQPNDMRAVDGQTVGLGDQSFKLPYDENAESAYMPKPEGEITPEQGAELTRQRARYSEQFNIPYAEVSNEDVYNQGKQQRDYLQGKLNAFKGGGDVTLENVQSKNGQVQAQPWQNGSDQGLSTKQKKNEAGFISDSVGAILSGGVELAQKGGGTLDLLEKTVGEGVERIAASSYTPEALKKILRYGNKTDGTRKGARESLQPLKDSINDNLIDQKERAKLAEKNRRSAKKSKEMWNKGDYIGSVSTMIVDTVKNGITQPSAVISHALESSPDLLLASKGIGAIFTITASDNLNTNINKFKKREGKDPSAEQLGKMGVASLAYAASEALSDKLTLGAGKGIISNKSLVKKLTAFVAAAGVNTTSEFGSGVASSVAEQAGENVGTDKDIDVQKALESGMLEAQAGAAAKIPVETAKTVDELAKKGESLKNSSQIQENSIASKVETQTYRDKVNGKENKKSFANRIAKHESRGDYYVFNRGQAGDSKGLRSKSSITVGNLLKAHKDHENGKKGMYAFGKYQITPDAFREAVADLNLKPNQVLTPQLQDHVFADFLMGNKRKDVKKFIRNINGGSKKNLDAAALALAQEFASIGVSFKGDKSFYKSGGNKAHMSSNDAKTLLINARSNFKKFKAAGMGDVEANRRALLGAVNVGEGNASNYKESSSKGGQSGYEGISESVSRKGKSVSKNIDPFKNETQSIKAEVEPISNESGYKAESSHDPYQDYSHLDDPKKEEFIGVSVNNTFIELLKKDKTAKEEDFDTVDKALSNALSFAEDAKNSGHFDNESYNTYVSNMEGVKEALDDIRSGFSTQESDAVPEVDGIPLSSLNEKGSIPDIIEQIENVIPTNKSGIETKKSVIDYLQNVNDNPNAAPKVITESVSKIAEHISRGNYKQAKNSYTVLVNRATALRKKYVDISKGISRAEKTKQPVEVNWDGGSVTIGDTAIARRYLKEVLTKEGKQVQSAKRLATSLMKSAKSVVSTRRKEYLKNTNTKSPVKSKAGAKKAEHGQQDDTGDASYGFTQEKIPSYGEVSSNQKGKANTNNKVSNHKKVSKKESRKKVYDNFIETVNKDGKSIMSLIKGVGAVKSKRISDYAKSSGGIKSLDELIHIKGIGKVFIQNLKKQLAQKVDDIVSIDQGNNNKSKGNNGDANSDNPSNNPVKNVNSKAKSGNKESEGGNNNGESKPNRNRAVSSNDKSSGKSSSEKKKGIDPVKSSNKSHLDTLNDKVDDVRTNGSRNSSGNPKKENDATSKTSGNIGTNSGNIPKPTRPTGINDSKEKKGNKEIEKGQKNLGQGKKHNNSTDSGQDINPTTKRLSDLNKTTPPLVAFRRLKDEAESKRLMKIAKKIFGFKGLDRIKGFKENVTSVFEMNEFFNGNLYQEVKDLGLNKQKTHAFSEFISEASRLTDLSSDLLVVPPTPRTFLEDVIANPLLGIRDINQRVPVEFYRAVGLASAEWVMNDSERTLFNDDQEMDNYFGRKASSFLSDKGVPRAEVVSEIGKLALDYLNLDIDAKGVYKEYMIKNLGLLGLRTLIKDGEMIVNRIPSLSAGHLGIETDQDIILVKSIENSNIREKFQKKNKLINDVVESMFGIEQRAIFPVLDDSEIPINPMMSNGISHITPSHKESVGRLNNIKHKTDNDVKNFIDRFKSYGDKQYSAIAYVMGLETKTDKWNKNLHPQIEGRLMTVKYEMSSVNEFNDMNTDDSEFRIQNEVFGAGRIQQVGKITTQRSKIMRSLYKPVERKQTLSLKDEIHLQSINQAFDEFLGETLIDLVDPEGNVLIPEYEAVRDVLTRSNGDVTTAELRLLRAASAKGGGKMQTFDSLIQLFKVSEAIKNNEDLVDLNLSVEVDGTTNGTAGANIQFGTKIVHSVANAVGILTDTSNNNADEWSNKEGNEDVYKQTVRLSVDNINEIKEELGNNEKTRFFIEIFERLEGIIESPIDIEGNVTQDGRNLAKPVTMTDVYGAGDASKSRSVVDSIESSIYEGVSIAYRDRGKSKKHLNRWNTYKQSLTGLSDGNALTFTIKKWDKVTMSKITGNAYSFASGQMGSHLSFAKDNILTASTVMNVLSREVFDKRLKDLEINGKNIINNKDRTKIIQEMHEDGLTVGFANPLSTNLKDSSLTAKKEFELDESLPSAQQKYSEANNYNLIRANKNGETKTDAKDNAFSASSSLSFISLGDTGVALLPQLIISLDMATISGLLNNTDLDITNVYDAIELSGVNIMKGSKELNEQWVKVNQAWSATQSIVDRLNVFKEEFGEDREVDLGEVDENGDQVFITVGEVISKMEGITESIQQNKDKLFSIKGLAIEQYKFKGSKKIIKDYKPKSKYEKNKDKLDITKRDYSESYSLKGSEPSTKTNNGNAKKVKDVKTITQAIDKVLLVDSSDGGKHHDYLSDLLKNKLAPVFSTAMDATIEMYETDTQTRGSIIDDTNIIVQLGKTPLASSMKATEVLAHEVTHLMFDRGIKVKPSLRRELVRVHREAARKIKPKQLEAIYFGSPQRVEKAEALWDYLFNSDNAEAEFAAYATTNEGLRDILGGIKLTPTKTIENAYKGEEGFSNRVGAALDAIFDLIIGAFNQKYNGISDSKKSLTVFDSLVREVAKTAHRNEKINRYQKYSTKINQSIIKGYRKFDDWYVSSQVSTQYDSIFKKAKNIAGLAVSGTLQNNVNNLIENGVMWRKNTLFQIFKELKGSNDDNRHLYDIIRYNKHNVDAEAQNVANNIKSSIKESFDERMKSKDWQVLTDGVARTEIHLISDNFGNQLMLDMMKRPELLRRKIKEFEKTAFAGLDSDTAKAVRLNQEALGVFMATGKARIPMLMLNSLNAINYHGFEPDDVNELKLMDTYAALHAMLNTPRDTLNKTHELLSREINSDREENGMDTLIGVTRYKYDKFSEPTNRMLGHVVDGNTNADVQIATSEEKKKELLKNGYVVHSTVNNKDSVDFVSENATIMVKKMGGLLKFHSGGIKFDAMQAKGTSLDIDIDDIKNGVGVFEPSKKRLGELIDKGSIDDKSYMIPNGSKIIHSRGIDDFNFRYMMNTDTRKDVFGTASVYDSLARSVSSDVRSQMSIKFNEWATTETTQKGQPNKQWVKVQDLLSNEKVALKYMTKHQFDNQLFEIESLLPKNVYKDLKDTYIDPAYLDLLFGYRALSLTDWTSRKIGLPEPIKRGMRIASTLWEGMITQAKMNIVVRIPDVLINNVISNTIILGIKTGNPVRAIKDMAEGYAELSKYQSLSDRKEGLKLSQKQYKVGSEKYNQFDSRINNVKARMERSVVSPLINEGVFQTIVEDVEIEDSPFFSALNKVTKGKGDSIRDKIPNPILRVHELLTLSEKNKLGSVLSKATQYSDFMARYALYKDLTVYNGKGKLAHKEAINEIMDSFILYDANTAPVMQWMNDKGLLMFTKFPLRILKVMINMIKDKPSEMAAFVAFDRLAYDTADITDTSFIPSIRNPIDVMDKTFELSLFNYLP